MKFKLHHFFLLALAVIAVDQAVKMAVYFNMEYGGAGEKPILGTWFKLHYTTNPGMAFGVTFGGDFGKIFLTLFRLGAMVAIGMYVAKLYKRKAHTGLIICISMILGGAVGNLVDSIFYAVFDHNLLAIPESGIAPSNPWFHGEVIDMFYFDLGDVTIPGIGSIHLWPIFNIADAAIFVSVIVIIARQKAFFPKKKEETKEEEHPQEEVSPSQHSVSE